MTDDPLPHVSHHAPAVPPAPGMLDDHMSGHQQAGQATGFETGANGPGFPPPGPRRRPRVRAITTIASALLLLLGADAVIHGLAAGHGTSRGQIILPGTLLGQSRNTSPDVQSIDRHLKASLTAGPGGKLTHVVTAAYGNPANRWFIVGGGGLCGTCGPRSPRYAITGWRARGYADARAFPAGRYGGTLVCFSAPGAGVAVIVCAWTDQRTGGMVGYVGGFASGFADAAAKTNQIRAAIEH